ncbi:MAG: alpha/beta hydrolase, partial [Parvularculaceae bacterium]|nr:alpha/beta hydrolase [Parvularculaceae bacterium]
MIPLEDWRDRAQEFQSAGRLIAYWTENEQDEDKPWLLLIHGYPTSSWDWNFIWPTLAERFRLAALDMLGFGLSEKPRAQVYSIIGQADLQEALLERLGAGEAHVLAHDYGDTVAQELLARHNEGALSFSLRSVCFLNGGLFPEQHRARPIQKLGLTPLGPLLGMMMSRARLKSTFGAVFGPQTQPSDAELDAHWELIQENAGTAVLHRLLHYIPERRAHRARWVGALKEARCPIRLVDGGADPVSGRHLFDYFRQEIPRADAVLARLDDEARKQSADMRRYY